MPGLKLDKKVFWIKENSWQAKMAAWKLGSRSVAIVFGKTIHLYHITKADFLKNERLVKHELCHVRQFQQHGYWGFLIKYLWESIQKGYYNNRFEMAARKAEADDSTPFSEIIQLFE
jgi:hypothetical protein